ncbi:hypothetical protein ABID56_001563 [Alkalibacillus flavidus]|uniref:Uncharacterized protein n=1 Tax=Alkalibacillus flavidus TaxID=546021 RepID=A0ABV2KV55_9BACI
MKYIEKKGGKRWSYYGFNMPYCWQGSSLVALGLWEFREGSSKKRFLTYTILGAFIMILSQSLVSFIGVLGIFR